MWKCLMEFTGDFFVKPLPKDKFLVMGGKHNDCYSHS